MRELIYACFLVLISEIGDKSQILVILFAIKYPAQKVILGVFIGSFLNHFLAVFLGFYLSKTISLNVIQIIAAISFICFGFWNLVQEDFDEDNKISSYKTPILTVATAFFFSELGDKTQLTAIALASQSNHPLRVLMGTVLGMVLASSICIWVGSKIGKEIPELALKLVSTGTFLTFGTIKLFNSIPENLINPYTIFVYFTLLIGVLSYLIVPLINHFKDPNTPLRVHAQTLYLNTLRVQNSLQNLCSMRCSCDSCNNESCPMFLLNQILVEAQKNNKYRLDNICEYPLNDSIKFNRQELAQCLKAIMEVCATYEYEDEKCIIHIARQFIEKQYFDQTIPFNGDFTAYYNTVKKLDKDFPNI